MNILIVSYMGLTSPTGVTTYYLALKNNFQRKGHKVKIITPNETPFIIKGCLKLLNYLLIIIRSDFFRIFVNEISSFLSIYFAVRKIRKDEKWEIIHGQDPGSSCAAKFALRGKIPVVTTCHYNDNPVKEKQIKYKLSQNELNIITKWFIFLFSKISNYIFVSSYCHRNSIHLLPKTINKAIIHNGVKKHFRNQNLKQYPNQEFIISNIGTLEERKNQILLLKASEHLTKLSPNFKITFYGDGPLKKEYLDFIKNKGLEKNIVFVGFRKNANVEITKSDLYVHTALNENCSIAIIEAFAAGLPVLALSTGGTPELFPIGNEGLLEPEIQPHNLAHKIYLFMETNKRKKIQEEQYKLYTTELTLENMIDKTLEFYNLSKLNIN